MKLKHIVIGSAMAALFAVNSSFALNVMSQIDKPGSQRNIGFAVGNTLPNYPAAVPCTTTSIITLAPGQQAHLSPIATEGHYFALYNVSVINGVKMCRNLYKPAVYNNCHDQQGKIPNANAQFVITNTGGPLNCHAM